LNGVVMENVESVWPRLDLDLTVLRLPNRKMISKQNQPRVSDLWLLGLPQTWKSSTVSLSVFR